MAYHIHKYPIQFDEMALHCDHMYPQWQGVSFRRYFGPDYGSDFSKKNGTPIEGDFYYDIDADVIMIFNGLKWCFTDANLQAVEGYICKRGLHAVRFEYILKGQSSLPRSFKGLLKKISDAIK